MFLFSSLSITAVLSNKCGFQLQYQMIFCVWLLAFSPQLCEQLRRYNVVPALSDILQESVKEKVTRIILAAFRVGWTLIIKSCMSTVEKKSGLFFPGLMSLVHLKRYSGVNFQIALLFEALAGNANTKTLSSLCLY